MNSNCRFVAPALWILSCLILVGMGCVDEHDSAMAESDGLGDSRPVRAPVGQGVNTENEPSQVQPMRPSGQMPTEMPSPETEIDLNVQFLSPVDGGQIDQAIDDGFRAQVMVRPAELAPFVSWDLVSSDLGAIPVAYDRETSILSADLSALNRVDQTLELTGRIAPDFSASFPLRLKAPCEIVVDFDQQLDPTQWKIMGTARQDPRGWLEMTNNRPRSSGAIFFIGAPFSPGDLDVQFRIAAGGCDEIGPCSRRRIADGLTMNIWNIGVADIDEFWERLLSGGNGGSFSATRLRTAGFMEPVWQHRPEGLTVEFDLFPNRCPGNGFWDPVRQPHVELCFDGRFYMSDCEHPRDHECHESVTGEERCMDNTPGENHQNLWSAAPQLVDNEWHDVHVTVDGTQVRVTLDGEDVVNTDVPDFGFKGGILTFGGGSGGLSAFQRFDDLRINYACP